jgi:hypothetical protein
MTALRRSQIQTGITSLLFLGGLAVIIAWQYPYLHTLRANIDTTRAATAAIAIEQQNLEDLQNQQATLSAAVNTLQKEVWLFSTEDEFYSAIQTIAEESQTIIPEPKLSDAVPNSNYQVRTGTITMSGTSSALVKAIDALSASQPLIAIQQITLTGGVTPQASLTIQTTWQ